MSKKLKNLQKKRDKLEAKLRNLEVKIDLQARKERGISDGSYSFQIKRANSEEIISPPEAFPLPPNTIFGFWDNKIHTILREDFSEESPILE